ncbi:MarR family winged helix-turn-helix transcriptional regulator [Virgibacillus sp. W0181]|uniref:MarR family winged helix-turn-helix transcriptional regulator n=1 Tax=Virgibacillus sp. W0181 TaxID=3391581 RepID=UPI003F476533
MDKNGSQINRPMALMQSFWKLQKSIMGQVKQTAADNDLSVPQFAILVQMQHKKQIAQKNLQERTHYPKSTLSHAIEKLVQAGLLNRTHAEGNRREMELALSDEGKVLVDELKAQEHGVHERFKNAVHSFTEEEFNDLINMHHQIATFFEGGGTK